MGRDGTEPVAHAGHGFAVRRRLPMRSASWRAAYAATALAFALTATPHAAADGVDGDSFAITNAAVFDGRRLLPQRTVLVRDGRIAAIGDRLDPGDLPVIDGTGATLLPGFIDGHTHTRSASELQEALAFGTTTVLDMGTRPEYLRELAAAAATRGDLADFRSPSLIATAPQGHGAQYDLDAPITSAADAGKFVAERAAEGATYIKVVLNGVRHIRFQTPRLDAAIVGALVTASHARRMPVYLHAENEDDVLLGMAAGVDGFAHHWRDAGERPALAARLARSGIFVVPTLTAPDRLNDGQLELLRDDRINSRLSTAAKARLAERNPVFTTVSMDVSCGAVTSLRDAGVLIAAGSDAGSPGIVHGASMHRTLTLLVRCGLSEVEALRSATADAATAFGLADRGRIAPGLRADMQLVRGDPTRLISDSRNLLKVWRAGIEMPIDP